MRKKGCYHKNRPFRLLVAAALRFVQSYLDLQELNREIIEELIDRIEVGERTVIDGQRHQDIKIYYRFVGLV